MAAVTGALDGIKTIGGTAADTLQTLVSSAMQAGTAIGPEAVQRIRSALMDSIDGVAEILRGQEKKDDTPT